MCHGDTTLTTFRWEHKGKPMLNTTLVPHKCVDWEILMDSVKERVVGKQEVEEMKNPNLIKSRKDEVFNVGEETD